MPHVIRWDGVQENFDRARFGVIIGFGVWFSRWTDGLDAALCVRSLIRCDISLKKIAA